MRGLLDRYFGRNDRLLLAAVLVGIVALFIGRGLAYARGGGRVVVTVDGETYGSYALGTDRSVPIMLDGKTENTLVIANGAAYMADATCPDRLCVRQGAISRRSQSIVCLPHRVVVTVVEGEGNALDSMTR